MKMKLPKLDQESIPHVHFYKLVFHMYNVSIIQLPSGTWSLFGVSNLLFFSY